MERFRISESTGVGGRTKQRIAWGPSEIIATGEFHGVNIGHKEIIAKLGTRPKGGSPKDNFEFS
jgi:hypothetical protein